MKQENDALLSLWKMKMFLFSFVGGPLKTDHRNDLWLKTIDCYAGDSVDGFDSLTGR